MGLNYFFPLAFMMNFMSMTGFMIVLGLLGESSLAADFGIVQGATLALFYSFSANARSVILKASSNISLRSFLISRIFLLVPLGFISFYLSVWLAGVNELLALCLIIRRAVEWISELHLSEIERQGNRKFAARFFVLQSFFP